MSNLEENVRKFMNISTVPVEIEEVDSVNVTDAELSEFIVADSIEVFNPPTDFPGSSNQQDAILIKRLMGGELSFTEYRKQMGQIDEVMETDYEEEVMHVEQVLTTKPSKKEEKFRLPKRKKSILPPALQGLMGEANLCYARGDTKLAEKVCLEIVRQIPLAAEPFITLAQIYESSNNEKCLQFMLIAAHLNPGDYELWMKIAEMSIERGNVRQAINAISRAMRSNVKNVDFHLQRIALLQSIGEDKLAFMSKYCMLAHIPKEQGPFLLQQAKEVMQRFHAEGQFEKALNALSRAYSRVPELFQIADINILLELFIVNKKYQNVLETLAQFVGFDLEIMTMESSVDIWVEPFQIPDDIILDFRSKLIVSLIHLKVSHMFDYLVENAMRCISVETDGDCHLDIAEAFMIEKFYENALKLLIPLVHSQNFSLAAVWLRQADCFRALGNSENAIESYNRVVELAPQHMDARLTLSALLKQKGMNMEALKALEQNEETDILDPKLIYERCFILKQNGFLHEYVKNGFLLLSRHCLKLRNKDEVMMICTMQRVSSKQSTLRAFRINRCEEPDDPDVPEFSKTTESGPTPEEEWELLIDCMKVSHQLGLHQFTLKFVFYGYVSRLFQNRLKELEFYALLGSIFQRDSYYAYKFVKEFIEGDPKNKRCWNIMGIIIQFSEDIRYYRYLNRLFRKTHVDKYLYIIQANYSLSSGTYKYALNDYLSIYKKYPDDLIALLVTITLAAMACQKFTSKKQSLVKQALCFLNKYKESRLSLVPNEVHYNLGRFYHQFGMNHLAMDCYRKCLDNIDPFVEEHEQILNLRKYAAFNLHLIYKASGNINAAKRVIFENIVV